MDAHFVVDSFSSLTTYGVWYTVPFVWVEFISDVAVENKLLVIFLDQNRQKIAAFVPEHLMESYNDINLVANVFVPSRFQIENFKYQEYPTHENYILLCGEFKVVISENTKLIPFESPFPKGFCLYPLVPSIQILKHDRRHQKIIIDVVGRIVMGKRKKGRHHFVLVLQDTTYKACMLKQGITMVDLSVEIIVFEILTRASTKVVGRSKSICKEWYALLSTQDFVRLHCSCLLISFNQRVLLIGDLTYYVHPTDFPSVDYGPRTIVSFPFNAEINDVSILSHLDGLLCVCLNSTSKLLLWNPTTNAYKHLSTSNCHGFFKNNVDAIGLYIDADDDYKVLHVKRRCGVLGVYVYSRRLDSWRNIPFIIRPEYVSPSFVWSPGTLCGDTLYFTVCECWVGGINVVIGFDVNSEQLKEMSFPPVPSAGIYHEVLVNVKNKIHKFVSTGIHEMSLHLWILEGEHWIKVLACPPIPLYHCHYGAL